MKKFRVYMTEQVEFSYDVMAESEEQAKDLVYQGEFDADTYAVHDADHCQIVDVEVYEDE